jgi:hypothetical protein
VAFFVGAILALSVGLFATFFRLDRDRAFYPTVTIVVASYYALFALIGDSAHALAMESVAILAFIVIAVVGFRTSLWLVAAALAAHGLFDLVHARLIINPGVPTWWPPFCLSFDVVAAAYLAWLLLQRRTGATAT